MKRKNKCAGKIKYPTKKIALTGAKASYTKRGIWTAIYECPVCLDFHLTSKWCNTDQYHKSWINSMYSQFIELERKTIKKFSTIKEVEANKPLTHKKIIESGGTPPNLVAKDTYEYLKKKNRYPYLGWFWRLLYRK